MTPHGPEHEERLARALVGEVDRAALERLLAGCARCAALHAELKALEERVRETAEGEREALAQTAAEEAPEGDALVAAFLEARRARARVWPRALAWLGGLALAAAAWLIVVRPPARPPAPAPERPRDGLILGPGEDGDGLAPRGAVASFEGPFRWDLDAGDGWFVVRVWAEGAPADGAPLSVSPHLTERAWSPPAVERQRWPARIFWEVQAFDATGVPLGAAAARAERSPR